MFRKKKKKIDEEQLPKAVEEMQNNQKREDKKRNRKNQENDLQEKLPRKKKKIKKVLLIFLVTVIIILAINIGISTHRWKVLAEDMTANKNSVVKDIDGDIIATIGSEKKKQTVTSSEMPSDIKNAYVAIEDERYYSHHGVDIKRTASAIFSYVIHFGSSSFGGSTITQQLVKNLTGDSTDSITRKVKEWWKAWQLETCLSKDEILETYLNVIYVGPNIYGVEAGAKYYFNKSVEELSLEECAFLAGINHSPNSYNPFSGKDNEEKIKNRTKTVLAKMQELGYIDSEDKYNEAVQQVEDGLNFKNGTIETDSTIYSYHTDALIPRITNEICEKYNISETFATNYLEMSGLTVYSTQDSKIQKQMETESEKSKYILKSKTGGNSSQAAMVIIDHKTGNVVGCTGGLGKKTESRSFNRATQSVRQTGSAIKPIAVLAPAIDKKIITASTIFNDVEQDFENGYHPVDYSTALGQITVRRAVESSQNIPFVEIMEKLKPSNSIKYLEKMGVTTLTDKDNGLPLALGGLEQGISPLEMAGAYSTIANDGVYIEPTFYTTVEKSNGDVVVKAKQKKKKVFSKEVAYILKSLLTQPVLGNNGTATYCKISGVDVAAKTGTTDENYDRWLCGFTPYYTAVTWYGFDINESIDFNNRNPAGLIWANVMSRIHIGLKSAKFEKPNTVMSVEVCSETGKKATTGCPNTYTEYFLWLTVPDLCDKHTGTELKDTENTNLEMQKNVTEIIQGITNDIDAEEPPRTTEPTTNTNTTNTNTQGNNKNENKNETTNNNNDKTNNSVHNNTNQTNTNKTPNNNTSNSQDEDEKNMTEATNSTTTSTNEIESE